MADRFVVRRIPEYGWAVFDRRSGDKAEGDEYGPWWPTRRAALAHKTAHFGSYQRPEA